jgi:hypothetical protein
VNRNRRIFFSGKSTPDFRREKAAPASSLFEPWNIRNFVNRLQNHMNKKQRAAGRSARRARFQTIA